LAQVKGDGLRLTGPGGFLSELVKAVLERGLRAELRDHLGYANGQSSTLRMPWLFGRQPGQVDLVVVPQERGPLPADRKLRGVAQRLDQRLGSGINRAPSR
ncbi:hypothetical protein F8271_30705, partial [Micromonospora sp. ALFpr18c]